MDVARQGDRLRNDFDAIAGQLSHRRRTRQACARVHRDGTAGHAHRSSVVDTITDEERRLPRNLRLCHAPDFVGRTQSSFERNFFGDRDLRARITGQYTGSNLKFVKLLPDRVYASTQAFLQYKTSHDPSIQPNKDPLALLFMKLVHWRLGCT